MRVLVTGGAGYIGSHACKALAAAGHVPVTFDNLRTGHRSAVRWGPFVHGDIADTRHVAEAMRTHGIEAVMHFAALAYVGESVTRPDLYYRGNVAATISLLDAMRDAEVKRLVFSSTCATFGVHSDRRIDEDTPQHPVNPYGFSKLFVEQVIRDYSAAFGLSAVMLRYFNAAGADPDGEIGENHDPETHLIPLVLKAAIDPACRITIFGGDYDTPDGTCIRDYIHVSDLADAHVLALSQLGEGSVKAYNLGTGSGTSVLDIVEHARRVTGRSIGVDMAARRAGDPPQLVADPSRANRELGWQPCRSDLESILSSAWAWFGKAAP